MSLVDRQQQTVDFWSTDGTPRELAKRAISEYTGLSPTMRTAVRAARADASGQLYVQAAMVTLGALQRRGITNDDQALTDFGRRVRMVATTSADRVRAWAEQIEMGPLPLVGLIEIARRAGMRRSVVTDWRSRYEDFPQPVSPLEVGPVFWWPHVERWLLATGRSAHHYRADIWPEALATAKRDRLRSVFGKQTANTDEGTDQ